MTLCGREVRRSNVSDNLVKRVDPVLTKPGRVLPDDVFVRGLVNAERAYQSLVVNDNVTVLPNDLREVVLDDCTRPLSDCRHVPFADLEAAYDHVAWHPSILRIKSKSRKGI
jgi:hypothetical protein